MLKWVGLFLFGGMFLLVSYLLIYLGALKSVQIEQTEFPERWLLYKEHIGSYHKTVLAIEEVEKWAQKMGVRCEPSFGFYLDSPSDLAEDRLRSWGGCAFLSPPQFPVEPGFLVHHLPKATGLRAQFEGSPAISPYKVYGKVSSEANRLRLRLKEEVLELYTLKPEGGVHTEYQFTAAE